MRALLGFLFSVIVFVPNAFGYRTSAWVPAWDPNALTSIQTNGGKLHEANPGWYVVAADGTITKNWNAENPTWRAAMSGMTLMPTIKNYGSNGFDGELAAAIVNDPARREAHAEAITTLVVTQAFDGIDIDYEALPASARDGFTQFVSVLATKLHGAGKKLSVTVHAKTSDSQTWSGPGAQDFSAIGQHADTVKIMAYDKHWSGSDPGPISPLDWLEKVAAYATQKVDAGKVIIGLPWYGYDWLGRSGRGVTYKEAVDLAAANAATVTRDANGEATFTYSGRTVFFQDAHSYAKKVDMLVAKFPALGGFAHWRSGAEDPAIWQRVGELHALGGGTGSVGATPQQTFSVSGPVNLSVRAGETATASYVVTGAGSFSVSTRAEKSVYLPGSAVFSAATVPTGGTAQLQISVDPQTAAGNYQVWLRFDSNTMSREVVLAVSVAAAAPKAEDFSVSGPATLEIASGKSDYVQYALSGLNGFTGAVTVKAQMIDQFAGSVSPNGLVVSANSAVTVSVAPAASVAKGTYRVLVRFSSATKTLERILEVKVSNGTRGRGIRR